MIPILQVTEMFTNYSEGYHRTQKVMTSSILGMRVTIVYWGYPSRANIDQLGMKLTGSSSLNLSTAEKALIEQNTLILSPNGGRLGGNLL